MYRFSHLIAVLLLVSGAPIMASDDDRMAIQANVDALFDAMRSKSPESLRAPFTSDARIGKITVDRFVEGVTSSDAALDEVTFDEQILVDGDLAMAWTPYNLFVNGSFQHCGIDLFIMKRIDEKWRIVQLEDTRRTVGCDPTRRD